MEVLLFHSKTPHFCSPFSKPKPKPKPTSIPSHSIQICQISLYNPSLKLGQQRWSGSRYGNERLTVECGKGSSVSELERELEENEMKLDDEEWMGNGEGCREKCKDRKGIVELMECLETEAIMGEDEGREAVDYNRRAQIFDKSNRVFQALKEKDKQHPK